MAINYTYQIAAVNADARCMEVVYSADGHETLRISTRIPYQEETVEQVVRMYAPIAYWLEKQRAITPPEVGYSGVVNAADEEAEALAAIEVGNGQQPTSVGSQTL